MCTGIQYYVSIFDSQNALHVYGSSAWKIEYFSITDPPKIYQVHTCRMLQDFIHANDMRRNAGCLSSVQLSGYFSAL